MLLNLQIKINYLDVFRPIGYMIFAQKNSHCSIKEWIKRLLSTGLRQSVATDIAYED
jgi:hypothetical protein